MTNIVCFSCKYYLGNLRCEAFEEEIPKEILEGKNIHDQKLKDQKTDLIFTKIKE